MAMRAKQQQLHSSSGRAAGPLADRSEATTYVVLEEHSRWASSCLAGSTAATDQYSYADASTDSSDFSEQLACTELLGGSDYGQQRAGGENACSSLQLACSPELVSVHEVREAIRNDMRREAETQPSIYFKRHLFLAKDARTVAVSWALQVCDQFRIEQETLFLAVSYLDRFLSVTQDVVHMEGLHLATLACLSLAAKQTEVTQPSTGEWVWLAHPNPWGTKEHLARMEWVIMEMLEWRGCTPTAWWFLHLFCFGLGICPAEAICTAAYLLELSLMSSGCLAFSYSALAAAALMLSHAPALPTSTPPSLTLVPAGRGTGQQHEWSHQVEAMPWEAQCLVHVASGWCSPGKPTAAHQDMAVAATTGSQARCSPGAQQGAARVGEVCPQVPVLTIHMLLELAPDLRLHQVQDACRVLADLHAHACALPPAQPDQALEGLALVCAKYSQPLWHHVAGPGPVRPLNLQGALERF